MIATSESLPLSLGQLARLVGALAFPNPEGGDAIVHGPGGPRVRSGAVEIRNAAIAVIRWAQGLAEQAAVIDLINGGQAMNKTASQPAPEPLPPAEPKKDPGSGDGNSTQGLPAKEPPTVVMKLIEPPVHAFVCSLAETERVKLPSPAGCGPDPWHVPVANESDRVLGLMLAGAQFELAAEASPLERLRDLFRRTAQELFRYGLHHPAIATA